MTGDDPMARATPRFQGLARTQTPACGTCICSLLPLAIDTKRMLDQRPGRHLAGGATIERLQEANRQHSGRQALWFSDGGIGWLKHTHTPTGCGVCVSPPLYSFGVVLKHRLKHHVSAVAVKLVGGLFHLFHSFCFTRQCVFQLGVSETHKCFKVPQPL